MEKTCPGRQTSTSRIIEVKRRTREHDNIEEKAGEKTYFLHERHRADRETMLDYFLLRLNIWRREEKRRKDVLKNYRGNKLQKKLNLFFRGKKLGREIG